jgi:hypothetical protein
MTVNVSYNVAWTASIDDIEKNKEKEFEDFLVARVIELGEGAHVTHFKLTPNFEDDIEIKMYVNVVRFETV